MKRITITEKDLTTPGVKNDTTDVVFIPGFSIAPISYAALNGDTSLGGAPAFFPILCSDVTTFEAYFGGRRTVSGVTYNDVPPYFITNQAYPLEDTDVGFPARAIPGYAEGQAVPNMFVKGDLDPSYIYARELISKGIPVVYMRLNQELPTKVNQGGQVVTNPDYDVTVANFYAKLTTHVFPSTPSETLSNKGDVQFKYVTSGGYPIFEYSGSSLANGMLSLCKERGDCVGIIDHTNNPGRSLLTTNAVSVYSILNSNPAPFSDPLSSFGTMFTPWMQHGLSGTYAALDEVNTIDTVVAGSFKLPASYAYLISLAKALKTYPSWLAIAGAARGVVPGSPDPYLNAVLTNAIAESYQPDPSSLIGTAINPITNIRPYGQTIWGNRTLKANSDQGGCVATSFLNIRNLVSDVKKQVYIAAKSLMFEQNNDILWTNFKGLVTPLLDQMQSGAAIKGYKIIKNTETDNDGNPLNKTKLSCIVRIYPGYAVESFDIQIQLSDEEVTVE